MYIHREIQFDLKKSISANTHIVETRNEEVTLSLNYHHNHRERVTTLSLITHGSLGSKMERTTTFTVPSDNKAKFKLVLCDSIFSKGILKVEQYGVPTSKWQIEKPHVLLMSGDGESKDIPHQLIQERR